MPSLRVIAVAVLIGMGAVAGAVSGVDHADDSDSAAASSTLRGSTLPAVSGSPGATGRTGTTGTTGAAGTSAGFDVRAENQQVTGVTAGWRISQARGSAVGLEAYADEVSVLAGERVPIAVSSQGAVRIRALRIGWYGGVGARLIWEGSLHALPEPADPDSWQARGWVDTTGWPEGHYLLRLDQTGADPTAGAGSTSSSDASSSDASSSSASSSSASRYLPLTVRSADARSKILVLTSPLSWQAENVALGAARRLAGQAAQIRTDGPTPSATDPTTKPSAGGTTSTPSAGRSKQAVPVARTASFNRPYAAEYGAGGFLADDEGIVQLAERSGRQLAYATDYDVARNPALLSQAAAVLVGGDSRFWTTSLRTAMRRAIDDGTNVAFFGAGTGSRLVTIAADGRSLKVSPGAVSTSVRLTGLRPSCVVGSGTTMAVAAGWTVSDAAWWGYRGTGLPTGAVLAGLVAGDVDRAVSTDPGSPPAVQVLSLNRVSCGPAASQGAVGDGVAGHLDLSAGDVQSATYQERASGAGVFATGVGRWTCAVVNSCVDQFGKRVDVDPGTRRFVVRVTRNVIGGFAQARAGRRHPARNSAVQYTSLR